MDSQRLIEAITDLVIQQLNSEPGDGLTFPSSSGGEGAGFALPAASAMPPCVFTPLSGGSPPTRPGDGTPAADPMADAAAAIRAIFPPTATPTGGQVLLVLDEGRREVENLPAQVRAMLRVASAVVVIPSTTFPATRLGSMLPTAGQGVVRILERPPATWDGLVRDSRVVVVPNLTLNAVAGLSMLAALEPCVGAMMAGLIEGRPVVAGCAELNFLSMNAAHLSKAFLDILRGHMATAASLGVGMIEMERLGETVARHLGPAAPVAVGQGRGRNVLTREDVETLLRSGQRTIEVASGTIVTPLARDVADGAGVEIVYR